MASHDDDAPEKGADGGAQAPEAASEPESEYRVGPGRPPREHQFKKDAPSPNPFGRPRKVPRLPVPLQHHQDVARSLGKTLVIGGEEVPFSVVNLGLLKKKALSGHAPSMRFLAKLDLDTKKFFADREREKTRQVDMYYRALSEGHPPQWIAQVLQGLADEFDQIATDFYKDPEKGRRAARKAAEKHQAKTMAYLRAQGVIPPEGGEPQELPGGAGPAPEACGGGGEPELPQTPHDGAVAKPEELPDAAGPQGDDPGAEG